MLSRYSYLMLSRLNYRRLIALGLLLAYAVAATGLPIAGPMPAKRSSERFPCEECGCGCDSAEVCWTRCCCNTLAGRLAWAKKENVRPPEEVLAQAQLAGHDVSRWLPGAVPSIQLFAEKPAVEKPKACCCCCKPKATPATPQDDSYAEDSAPSWASLACGGAMQLWMSISVALPAPDADAPPTESLLAVAMSATPALFSVTLTPPTPPPQRAG
jgi:hypothetical protein